MTYVNPKSLFLKLNIYILKSNPASQVYSSISNDHIDMINALFLDPLDGLISASPLMSIQFNAEWQD
jgi:hypothetical protein